MRMTLLTACLLIAVNCNAGDSGPEESGVLLEAQRAFATNGYETAWAAYTANTSAFEAGIRGLHPEFLKWLIERCHKEYGRKHGRYLSLMGALKQAYYRDPKTDPVGYAESIFIYAELMPEMAFSLPTFRAHFKRISQDERIPRGIRDEALLRIADIDRIEKNYEAVLPVLAELATRTNTVILGSAMLLTARTQCEREHYKEAEAALAKLPAGIPAAMQTQAASLRGTIEKRLAEIDRINRMPIPCFGPFDVIDIRTGEPWVVPFTYPGPPYPRQAAFTTAPRSGNSRDAELVDIERKGDSCRAQVRVIQGKAIPGDGILQVQKDDLLWCSLTREFKATPGYRRTHTNDFAMHQSLAVRSVRSIVDTSKMPSSPPDREKRSASVNSCILRARQGQEKARKTYCPR